MHGRLTLHGSTPLPSQAAADDLLDGKPGALGDVALSVALRSGLIAGGLYMAGLRGKTLVRGTVYSALAIEAFVLAWVALNRESKRPLQRQTHGLTPVCRRATS